VEGEEKIWQITVGRSVRVNCCWSAPAQSVLVSGPVVTHTHVLVLCKTSTCFQMWQFVDTMNLHEIYYIFLLSGEFKFCFQSVAYLFLRGHYFCQFLTVYIFTLSFRNTSVGLIINCYVCVNE
jgi:hypothetical protein